MDYIDTKKQKKLYVGTSRGVILTIDISEWLSHDIDFGGDFDDMLKRPGMFDDQYAGIQPGNFNYGGMDEEEYQQMLEGEEGDAQDEPIEQIPAKASAGSKQKPSKALQDLMDDQEKIL